MGAVAAEILNVLRTADRPLRQFEIAERANLVKSSVRREVQILENTGEVVRDVFGNDARAFSLPSVDDYNPDTDGGYGEVSSDPFDYDDVSGYSDDLDDIDY